MSLWELSSVLLGVTLLGVSSPVTLAQKSGGPPAQVKPVTPDLSTDLAEKAACRARLNAVRGYRELLRQEKETLDLLSQLEGLHAKASEAKASQANAPGIDQVNNKLSVLRRQIAQQRAQICAGSGGPGTGKPGAGNP